MFKAIRNRWRAAGEEVIRQMWDDLDDRLLVAMSSGEASLEIATALEEAMRAIAKQGDWERMTDDQKREIAATLREAARKRKDVDPNGAHAFGTLCLWLESQTLPGEIAAEVRDEALEKINELLEGLERFKEFAEKRRVELADKKGFTGDAQSFAVKLVMTIERWMEGYGHASRDELEAKLRSDLGKDRYAIHDRCVILLPAELPEFKVEMIPPPRAIRDAAREVEFCAIGAGRYAGFMLIAKGPRRNWTAGAGGDFWDATTEESKKLVHDLWRNCGVVDLDALRRGVGL